uniref:Selenoprotein S n=1 Tax=Astyanax mexicanus TaxID=7994 RepID=A0A8B9LTU2_ASTMX
FGSETYNLSSPLRNQCLKHLCVLSSLFSEYGWYLLLLSGGVYLLIQHLNKKRSIQDRSSASTSSSDPVSVVRRQEALEASRQRMQAELDAKAAEFKEKQQRVNEVWSDLKRSDLEKRPEFSRDVFPLVVNRGVW